jgi:hypothetical protein
VEAGRYVLMSVCLGALAVWASENFFWMMPPPDLTLAGLGLTVIAYSVAAAVALSAVIWAGVAGLKAAFLGGAILGYMTEGVVVGTIYQPPLWFYLVWTPLAWHALVSGALVLGVGRARISPWQKALVWLVLGLWGAFWAQYWVSEHASLPSTADFAVYLLGFGLVVPVAQIVLDRMGRLPAPSGWVLWVAPGIALAVWIAQFVADLNPLRLLLPAVLAGLLWTMRRQGNGRKDGMSASGPVLLPALPVWHHLLFLITPAVVITLAPIGWAQGWGTLNANYVVAVLTSIFSLVWLLRLALKARQG